ncbi:MAG: hypothetical protein LBE83_04350, partial [Propionibacteriaceae bacterium]|nr:hypothetical protein [Propionibacteriaceae bacterium]
MDTDLRTLKAVVGGIALVAVGFVLWLILLGAFSLNEWQAGIVATFAVGVPTAIYLVWTAHKRQPASEEPPIILATSNDHPSTKPVRLGAHPRIPAAFQPRDNIMAKLRNTDGSSGPM